jgi:hypothetical protein
MDPLIKHQVYLWQLSGCQWMMPISEQVINEWDWSTGYKDKRDISYVNILACVSLKELNSLPRYDNIRDYMVKREIIKSDNYRRKVIESVWELPRDKFNQLPFYKNYRLRKSYLLSSLLIPIDIVRSEYPELISDHPDRGEAYPLGVSDNMVEYKREFLIKQLLNEIPTNQL